MYLYTHRKNIQMNPVLYHIFHFIAVLFIFECFMVHKLNYRHVFVILRGVVHYHCCPKVLGGCDCEKAYGLTLNISGFMTISVLNLILVMFIVFDNIYCFTELRFELSDNDFVYRSL